MNDINMFMCGFIIYLSQDITNWQILEWSFNPFRIQFCWAYFSAFPWASSSPYPNHWLPFQVSHIPPAPCHAIAKELYTSSAVSGSMEKLILFLLFAFAELCLGRYLLMRMWTCFDLFILFFTNFLFILYNTFWNWCLIIYK